MTKRQDEAGKLFLHTWEAAEEDMLIHLSTSFKFFCEPKQPTPDDPDNWNLIDVYADHQRIAAEAEMDGKFTDQYIDFLARTSMEMADKALSTKRQSHKR